MKRRLPFASCPVILLVLAGVTHLAAPSPLSAQEPVAAELKEKLSRVGVFFRADAPLALRNADDPHLPIFVEIINGVEKAAHTTGASVAQYIQREPLKLEGINLFIKPPGKRREFASDPLLLGESKDFSFDLRSNGQPTLVTDRLRKTLEVPRDRLEDYLRRHFIGGPFRDIDVWVALRVTGWPSQDFYLRVRLNPAPLPTIPNWYRGDPHYHTAYTDNPAERGYPLGVVKQAALDAGFDWLLLADHSTDLSPERFAEELRDVKKYRDGRLMMIRGEEITTSSGKETLLTTVHMVAAPSPDDPDKGFPNALNPADVVLVSGDGSPSSPAMPIKDALARIAAAGGFAYAAHPFDPISPVMRGGSWDLAADFLSPGGSQLQPGLVGLEPWNRATLATADDARDPFCLHRDADPSACFQPDKEADQYARLEKGIGLGWRPLLQKGLQAREGQDTSPAFKIFLAAGSDAHGDLNYEATMDAVDFISKPSRGLYGYAEDNALGRISTVVYAPDGMGPRGENVLRALREGRSVVSNGPLLIAGFDRNGNGRLDDPEDVEIGQEISAPLGAFPALQLFWVSSEEFGPLISLRLIVGSRSAEASPVEVPIPAGEELSSGGLVPVDLRPHLEKLGGAWGYVRLEARTRTRAGEEFRCYTNPIWIRATGQ